MESATDCAVAVCSRSFSRHEGLRHELLARYPRARFNSSGARLAGDELARFLDGAEKAIVALERIDGPLLARLPELRVISKFGVGLDGLSLDALDAGGVQLGWTGGVNRRAVAELVIAQCIAWLRGLTDASRAVRRGGWSAVVGRELGAMTVGLIGCGHVGKEVARLLRAFGARVLVYDVRVFPSFNAEHGVTPVDLATLLEESNIVSLHVPLDDTTANILDADRLAAMRPGALLVNTARGGLVDEAALYDRLVDGHLGGAAFDVLADEPPVDNPLLTLDQFVCTPHLAGSTEEALMGMGRAAIVGLDRHRSVAEHRADQAAAQS